MTDKKLYVAAVLFLFIVAWWFRYETHCTEKYCISYDRLTGQWILPVDKIKE